ncbi:DUF2846 domain-containing protein [Telmatospirillum sp.]|uniref:DUF2846 domain-containing protein n=1 Tax=Telmatospirillum sp. TaxID=2079197 RepID=UPI0028441962|nr:DUF2846 domain-containing protein [Telmatospirillum sp.]MDR3435278.1 DUF2846 domain-containing protein [Telmatospirillum sp.]
MVGVFIVTSVVFGNRRVGRAGKDETANARTTGPRDGESAVFIFRRNRFAGKAKGGDVLVDGRPVGQLRGGTYYRLDLPAGVHVVQSRPGQAGIALSCVAGARVFVEQTFNVGLVVSDVGGYERVDETEGVRLLDRCRLFKPTGQVGGRMSARAKVLFAVVICLVAVLVGFAVYCANSLSRTGKIPALVLDRQHAAQSVGGESKGL